MQSQASTKHAPQHPQIQQLAWFRMNQIIGDPKKNIPPLLPLGRSTFLNRVKDGTYPKPSKLGKRLNVWSTDQVKEMLAIGGK